MRAVLALLLSASFIFAQTSAPQAPTSPASAPANPASSARANEYLWYEAENMQGFSTNERFEPVLNPSWVNPSKVKAPGWGINGPGVSAEWTQGGESEWNSAAASADETRAVIFQNVEVPRAGAYKIWVRYADWAAKGEHFTLRITQGTREALRHEFGVRDLVDSHDEVSLYWGWAFAWDSAAAMLDKGSARVSIEIEKAAAARRHVDCWLLTNDAGFVASGREKPDFAAMRSLREWNEKRTTLAPLIPGAEKKWDAPIAWRIPKLAGRDFLMPWNIAREFWTLYEQPAQERPLYPFHAEPVEQFVTKYKGAREVPIFDSKLVVPVIYINDLPQYLREGSAFLRYLRETRAPFAVLINYGAAQMTEDEGRAAWKLLTTELREQFLGWVSGESVGYVWDSAATELKLKPEMSRRELLELHRAFYTRALEKKWSGLFHTETGAMWDKLIPAQSTSSTSFAHALGEWGTRLIGIETAAVQPGFGMRLAFTRGAARQFGGALLYYHAPNFGDSATTFTKTQNFAGPDNFFHSRYGATMGPSLSWYRKSYYLYYMAGASAIYLEQGFDQFFKPGPGEHPFQLNPLGRITNEFMRFAERHAGGRGVPYTPIALLLDPAHGWEMTDYPHWPFGVSQLNRSDRALRELFGAAYYPLQVVEGEAATADRQAFVNGIFGDIFDVLVASDAKRDAIDDYRALIVGGRVEWNQVWAQKLADYARRGGVVVLNAAQVKGLPVELLGIEARGEQAEADAARCLLSPADNAELSGQVFRYEKITTRTGTRVLMTTPAGDPLVTMNTIGQGRIIYVALPDLLGLDERMTPFAAHLIAHLASEATPVRVGGDVEYLINRTANGWVVTLFNNRGVFKPQQGMARVDRSAYVEVTVGLRGKGIRQAREWTTEQPLEVAGRNGQDSIRLNIAPGGVQIVELTER